MSFPKKKKYGRWTLKEYKGMTEYFHHLFIAKCKCGTTKIVRLCNLKSGQSKGCAKCGNLKTKQGFKKYLGQKKISNTIKTWKIIRYIGSEQWICKCIKCGILKIVRTRSVSQKTIRKCLCQTKGNKKNNENS